MLCLGVYHISWGIEGVPRNLRLRGFEDLNYLPNIEAGIFLPTSSWCDRNLLVVIDENDQVEKKNFQDRIFLAVLELTL